MLEHGGNLADAARLFGIALDEWLDLSTGINPNHYPIPEIPSDVWQRLPPPDDGLVEAARSCYGSLHILPTAGSQAALQALPAMRKPCRVAIACPMYAEHAQAWARHGHAIIRFHGNPDAALLTTADVLVVCNPNNPDARLHTPEQLMMWHARIAERGGWLVVDEAFMDATPEFSIAGHTHLPGLIVLRSLGKFFGLAGARVGFVLAADPLLRELEAHLGPWPISGPARIVAKAALQDIAWQEAARRQLRIHSERLAGLLSRYGLPPQAGTALFQWVNTARARAWHMHMARQGIWLRKFDEPQALRFGLPPADGWMRLEQALAAFNG
ncbi:MAG TPA: threonine-phosphate decarboxylase CobD [Methylophilaceae bacterium]|nr:threonine-phosphate decarboxylase CobD [Methylophilaceae bacterium]